MTKVLVCDDENGLRQVLVNLLKPMGYTVFQAEDGNQAITTIRSESPDLLLLDMRLPDMDGLEILAEAKKIHPSMPVVMLSGFGDVETAVGAIKKGAYDYLSKPFRVDDVRSVVKKALEAGAAAPVAAAAGSAPAASPQIVRKSAGKGLSKKVKIGGAVAAGLLVILGSIWALKGILVSAPPDKEFSVPYQNPTALFFFNDNLWISDWVAESIYKHNLDDNLTVAQIYALPGSHPTGLTWDGSSLWSCNSWEGKIYKHNLDDKLTIAKSYDSPGPEPSGLFWDGVNLWVCDVKEAKIYQLRVSADTLPVVNEFASPGPKPIGFFSDGTSFWSADTETNNIYKHAKDAKLTVKNIYVAAPYRDKRVFISGLTFDGKNIWSCADDNSAIYRHNIKNLQQIKF